ncbi:MAG: DEAD/DEAH box helicase [Gammaproteobacteria bacterium]|nr:DEAD/DEAH box helicase [Gammaproteobacteria bacterium]
MTEQTLTQTNFSELPLCAELLAGTRDAGFDRCTPIQAQSLPLALAGEDVAGQALTGTGKTAAFLVACMQLLLDRDPLQAYEQGQPRALILAPTRELAVQIHQDAAILSKHTGLRCGVVFGGTAYESQRQMVAAGLDILIGTPGRVIDYFKQGVFNLRGAQVVILDEADRMFDLGFIRDIRYLLRRLPPAADRVNMLFSATMSFRVTELAYEHMNDPTLVNASPAKVTVDHVTQVLYHVAKEEKISLLLGLLRRMDAQRTIVFVNTKRGAERVTDFLNANGYMADVLSGDVPQKKRLRLLGEFQAGALPILVATDVAARGLHIPEVSHVFNFDLPQDPEDYVHRIGRTARAGARGDAVSFGCEEFVFSLEDIEAFICSSIPVEAVSDDMLVEPVRPPRRPRQRLGGQRPGGRRSSDGQGRRRRSGGKAGRIPVAVEINATPTGSSVEPRADGARQGVKKPRRPRRRSDNTTPEPAAADS